MQNHKRFAALLTSYLHVVPAKLGANAGAERFRNGFLRCEPCGEKRGGHAMGKTIANLVRVQNAIQKSFTKALVRRLDSRHLDNINAHAQNHAASASRRTPSSTRASLSPPG